MDGLKGVLPNSCSSVTTESMDIFGNVEQVSKECEGCQKDTIKKHNGIYSLIKDWNGKDPITGKKGKKVKFIDLIKK